MAHRQILGPVRLFSAGTTGTSDVLNFAGRCVESAWAIECSAGVTGGTIKLEHALSPDYAGAWAEIVSFDLSTSLQQLYQHTGRLWCTRLRFTANAVGGTVIADGGGG